MSGNKARAARHTAGATTELHALLSLIQWYALPAGACAQCGTSTGAVRRALLTVIGALPVHDAIPGDPVDEAAADARFQRLAKQQQRGEYEIGSMQALCPACAALALASVPDGLGVVQAYTRRMLHVSGTDAVFMHGEAGADKSARWSVASELAGALLPKLESNLLDTAAEYLSDTPRAVFAWEGPGNE